YDVVAGLDAEIQPSSAALGSGNIVDFLFDSGSGTNTIMTCATCHDVHGVTGVSSFLLESNAGSVLCLRCHIK
ncbi:MAG: cytochrome c3 family protein, partial [Desulfuromusa sp.]|nr:cytochrome c3 family protein [Desulfuromusa sp.]